MIALAGMRDHLRAATADAHAALDRRFDALDLAERSGFARFLAAHAIALASLHARYAAFAADALRCTVPDYPALLAADLADLDVPSTALGMDPVGPLPPGGDAGLAYVLAGSRLGMAVIRRRPTFTAPLARRYVDDATGHDAWRAFLAWDEAAAPTATEEAAARHAALETFALFEHALDHALATVG